MRQRLIRSWLYDFETLKFLSTSMTSRAEMLMFLKECWGGSSCSRGLLTSLTNACEVKYEFNMLTFWRFSSANSLFINRLCILVEDFPNFNICLVVFQNSFGSAVIAESNLSRLS